MCNTKCIKCDDRIKEGRLVCKICDGDVCYDCEHMGYKCDTGYGDVDIRICDENNICPVCHSDPNGEHKEWFINYMETHKECEKCKWVIGIDDEDCDKCVEREEQEEENDDRPSAEEFFKKLRTERIKRRAFRDLTNRFINCNNTNYESESYYDSEIEEVE